MSDRFWFRGMPLVAVLALAAGCQRNVAAPPPAKTPEVKFTYAVKKDVVDYEDFTGTLEAFKKVEITSRVTGYLDKVHFKEGAMVKKGDVLFEIDARPAKAEFDRAEAAVVQAQARFNRLNGDLQRAQELLRSRSISKEEFEKVAGDYEEAKASVGVAVASRKTAHLTLEYTKVLAPIDGRASRAWIDEGNLVKADATPLTMVVTKNPIYAYFDVDERTYQKLKNLAIKGVIATQGSDILVKMALADEEGFPRTGRVDFEDNVIDVATGTKRFRAVFDNGNDLLAPGMFVRVRFQVGVPHPAIVVPEIGVGTDQGQKFLYTINDKNEVVYRKIKTGALEQNWRVVEEGVAEGDRVVVSGLQRIRPMMKVEPIEEKTPPAAGRVSEPALNLPKDAK